MRAEFTYPNEYMELMRKSEILLDAAYNCADVRMMSIWQSKAYALKARARGVMLEDVCGVDGNGY